MIKKAKPLWQYLTFPNAQEALKVERGSIAEELEHIIIEWIEIYECCESCQPLCDKLRALAKELRSGQR